MTLICSHSDSSYRRTCQATADFLLDFHQVWKESGGDKSTGLIPELTLKELVFLHHKYYSIFLLQQEASALWNTVVINDNGILIHCFLLGVKLWEELHKKGIFWKLSFVSFK
jgi:hypothetical protein